ncbi:hypothetical protein FOA52_001247 [Chlamydomonas sp. UWO 241]|nr:hypothetical protein FOA52_001247 [Chlamydomonas sp. UWO 241]
MAWAPQPEGLVQLAGLLGEFQKPGSNQAQILQQLEQYGTVPDINNYLVFLFACSEQLPVEVRQGAGLLLKNNLKKQFRSLPAAFQAYIKEQLLLALAHPQRPLRHTCGTIVSVVVGAAGLSAWPQLVSAIASCMASPNETAADGGVSTLYKIIEDQASQMECPVQLEPGSAATTASAVLTGVTIKLMQSTSATARAQAVACLNLLAREMPTALIEQFDRYLEGLFALTCDVVPGVRREVCVGLVQLLAIQPDRLQPFLYQIIEYMLASNEHADQDVAVESCEFWMGFCDAELDPDLLRPFLPRLIPLLMKNMVFDDYDDEVGDAETAETAGPGGAREERDSELKPFMASDRAAGAAGGGEGDEEADDDEDGDGVSRWNLRRCSAAGLDRLSLVYGDELLPILLPIVEQRLGDGNWRARESAILALGAVAEGCHTGLMPYLEGMVSMLLPKTSDPRPMVRIISCWAMARYSRWLFSAQEAAIAAGEAAGPAPSSPLPSVIQALLQRTLDHNKFVQEAACSAIASAVEEAVKEGKESLLHLYLRPILETLGAAVSRFSRRNLRLLYDVLDTLADAMGPQVSDPQLSPLYLGPMFQRFQAYDIHDKDLLPLMDCLANMMPRLGAAALAPYARAVFDKCMALAGVQMELNQAQQLRRHTPGAVPPPSGSPPVEFDIDALVCALDVVSGLTEAMGPGMEALATGSQLGALLAQSCRDEEPSIRQSAFAMVGDLAKAAPGVLAPVRADVVSLALLALDPAAMTAQESIKACNNACWALGELVVSMGPEALAAGGGAPRIAEVTAGILMHRGRLTRGILENAAITLGRVAWVAPEHVAPHLAHFVAPWCAQLRVISDGSEKEQAFLGLCNLISRNPEPACAAFGAVCGAVVAWRAVTSEGLANSLSQVMQGMKQHLGAAGHWGAAWASLDAAVRSKLEATYQL